METWRANRGHRVSDAVSVLVGVNFCHEWLHNNELEMEMSKVFLGGTCNESTWRDELMPVLQVDYFNPVVDDWTPDCQEEEERQKANCCDVHLYVITSDMTGTFSIAEAIESAMTPGKHSILHVIPDGFGKSQIKSLQAVAAMVIKHGGVAYIDDDLRRTARVLNNCYSKFLP